LYTEVMKKLILILLFSTVIFSSPSYAEWTKVHRDDYARTYYVDFERIRRDGVFVYWWDLGESPIKGSSGNRSNKSYNIGNCREFTFKFLSSSTYKLPSGAGIGVHNNTPDKKWRRITKGHHKEYILKALCQ
jgi:hypothetical protein